MRKDPTFKTDIYQDLGFRKSSRISGLPADTKPFEDLNDFPSLSTIQNNNVDLKQKRNYEHPVKTEQIFDKDYFNVLESHDDYSSVSVKKEGTAPASQEIKDLVEKSNSLTMLLDSAIKVTTHITLSDFDPSWIY